MSLLDAPRADRRDPDLDDPSTTDDPTIVSDATNRPERADATVVENAPAAPDARDSGTEASENQGSEDGASRDPSRDEGRPLRLPVPPRIRIGRVRLRSVAKFGAVFTVLGYLVTVGTSVAVWNVLQRLGFVETTEQTVVDALGIDSFELAGQAAFDLVLLGAGVLFVTGFVVLLLLALVYNAACAVFGGVAFETSPVRNWRQYRKLVSRR